MSFHPVRRVSGISREVLEKEYIAPGMPVVLEDAARDWPAISKWTVDYLVQTCGDRPVRLRHFDLRRPPGEEWVRSDETIEHYLSRLPRVGYAEPYLAEQRLGDVLPPLVDDIGVSRYGSSKPSDLRIMLGAKTLAPLHFHIDTEAISIQMTGTRRFLLFPPSDTEKLDPVSTLSPLCNFGRRNVEGDGCEDLNGLETILKPGEGLYIPVHWWHTVFASADLSILLADFFQSPWSAPAGWRDSEIKRRFRSMRADRELLLMYMRRAADEQYRARKVVELESGLPLSLTVSETFRP